MMLSRRELDTDTGAVGSLQKKQELGWKEIKMVGFELSRYPEELLVQKSKICSPCGQKLPRHYEENRGIQSHA